MVLKFYGVVIRIKRPESCKGVIMREKKLEKHWLRESINYLKIAS